MNGSQLTALYDLQSVEQRKESWSLRYCDRMEQWEKEKVKWLAHRPLAPKCHFSVRKLTSTLIAGLPYAQNRSLDLDLFCGGWSARLPSMSQVHKMNSHPGIIIYAASHSAILTEEVYELQRGIWWKMNLILSHSMKGFWSAYELFSQHLYTVEKSNFSY